MAFYWWVFIAFLVLGLFLWLFLGHDANMYSAPFMLKNKIAEVASVMKPDLVIYTPQLTDRELMSLDAPPASVTEIDPRPVARSPRLPPANIAEPDSRHIDITPMLPAKLQPQGPKAEPRTKKVYEMLTHKVTEHIFQKRFRTGVRDLPWLKNNKPDKNGRFHPLEIDIYNDELRIGIEYHGIQHFKWPNYYHHETDEGYYEFQETVRRDALKLDLCDENGVYLITVPYNCHTNGPKAASQIEEHIRYYLPDAVRAREESKRQATIEEYPEEAEMIVTMHDVSAE